MKYIKHLIAEYKLKNPKLIPF